MGETIKIVGGLGEARHLFMKCLGCKCELDTIITIKIEIINIIRQRDKSGGVTR